MGDLERIKRDGFVRLDALVSASSVEKILSELEPHFGLEGWGRNDFEGLKTERVYSVLAKCPSVAELVEHPRILAILDEFLRPSRLLAACQGTRIHPGEIAQTFHADDELGAPPRPRMPLGVSVMWALSEFTSENGSTLIVPGSHDWADERRPDLGEAVSVDMKPGSAVVWLGGVFHGADANRSASDLRTGMSIIYYQPWMRKIENMTLAVPPEVASQYSENVQRMLGYSVVDGLFFGHVDGRDPIKLIKQLDAGRQPTSR
jgi:ectoine hydroxylase-related dioxygenase (phytanoyl-CoA dioxygenase family)